MQIAQIEDELGVLVRDLEPATFDAAGARDALATWGRVGRLAAAASALLAKRIDDLEAWETQGAHSAAQAVARELGTSVTAAKDAIDTAAKLEWLPATRAALLDGHLSVAQASAVAQAALAAPDEEGALLDAASRELLGALKKKCSEVRLRAETDDDAAERRRASRKAMFRDGEPGMQRWTVELPNVMAGEIGLVWDCFTERAFRQARSEGRREPEEAYRVDGLLAMARAAKAAVARGIEGKRIQPHFIIRIDIGPLLRIRAENGETCEIAGVGPVDLTEARNLMSDAVLQFVLSDGVDIQSVAHGGRKANVLQMAAVWSRPYVCETDGCGHAAHLQLDHIDDYARSRQTCATKLGWKCGTCHDLKTTKKWRDGALQRDGKRPLIPPWQPDPPP